MRLKVAVTFWAVFIVTWQIPVPVQAPRQPIKIESAKGVAVKVTGVSLIYCSVQSLPQSIPLPITLPLPVPALLTVKANLSAGTRPKVAVTF
ncbi:MAG: hypothetical protein DRR19_12135 [Candidatus Parabeggiatoa sp. nov. 1]|nr:MAG: hypothetical protein DRR19_12135 [Gammaproteobacteria bacterium]